LSRERARRLILIGALVLATPFAWNTLGDIARPGVATPVTNPADFRPLICAARVLRAGYDPYRTEPLRTCEQNGARQFGLQMLDGLVLPVPLPPYAFALFEPVALLPLLYLNAAWFALGLIAVGLTTVCVMRLAGVPLVGAALSLVGADAYVSIPQGQIVPFVLALLCAAALAARAGRSSLAAMLCALATVEPHLGLPSCLALFAFERRARVTLAACALAAIVTSLAVAGPALCLEYVRAVLPLQAASQVTDLSAQLSSSVLLYALGIGGRTALAVGSALGIAMLVGGVLAAGAAARRLHDPALFVLVPPAFAVFGAPYVHLAQIAIAIPAGIVLWSRLPRGDRLRALAFAGLVALAIPWSSLADGPAVYHFFWPHPVAPRQVVLPSGDATSIAEISEMHFSEGGGYGSNGGSLVTLISLKLPTWFGLATVAIVTLRFALRGGQVGERGTPALREVQA